MNLFNFYILDRPPLSVYTCHAYTMMLWDFGQLLFFPRYDTVIVKSTRILCLLYVPVIRYYYDLVISCMFHRVWSGLNVSKPQIHCVLFFIGDSTRHNRNSWKTVSLNLKAHLRFISKELSVHPRINV